MNASLPEGVPLFLRNWRAHSALGAMDSTLKTQWCMSLKAARPGQFHGSLHGTVWFGSFVFINSVHRRASIYSPGWAWTPVPKQSDLSLFSSWGYRLSSQLLIAELAWNQFDFVLVPWTTCFVLSSCNVLRLKPLWKVELRGGRGSRPTAAPEEASPLPTGPHDWES